MVIRNIDGPDLTKIQLRLLYSTDRAYKFTEDEREEDGRFITYWLPKSQVEIEPIISTSLKGPQDIYEVELPVWMAREKGLI